jgi:hypothetical protein
MGKGDLDLTRVIKQMEKLIQDRLRSQAPVAEKSSKGNPKGKLRRSIKVKGFLSPDGLQFKIGFETYGVFLDEGTGPYYKGPSPDKQWTKDPGPGKGGIKPRYWTHVAKQDALRFKTLIANEVRQQVKGIILGKQ